MKPNRIANPDRGLATSGSRPERKRLRPVFRKKPKRPTSNGLLDIDPPSRAYSRSDFQFPNLNSDQRLAADCWDAACGRAKGTTPPLRRLDPAICQAEAAKQALLLIDEATRISDNATSEGWVGLAVSIVSKSWSAESYRIEIHRKLKRDTQRWLRRLDYPAIFIGAIDVCKNRVRVGREQTAVVWQPHCHGEILARVPGGDIKRLKSDLRQAIKATGRGEGVPKPVVCRKLFDPEGWRLYVATSLMLRGVTERSQWQGADGETKVRTAPLSAKDKRTILLEWSRETPQSRFVLVGLRKQGDRLVPLPGRGTP